MGFNGILMGFNGIWWDLMGFNEEFMVIQWDINGIYLSGYDVHSLPWFVDGP